MLTLESKLPDIGTTIFTVMSALALEHKAVNLGQGFPDFDGDARLHQAVTQAMAAGLNQYPQMMGIPALRSEIARLALRNVGHDYDPHTQIVVTSGATQALFTAAQALVRAGDEVILLEPSYDSYAPAVRLAGGVAVPVALRAPTTHDQAYTVDWDAVRAAITPHTRVLWLNFPHNPTGAILSAADLDELERIVAAHDILLLSDEVYEYIVFDDVKHLSPASRPALAQRTLVISSFGKTFHTTGWKIGWACGPQALIKEFAKVHQFVVFTVPSPMQHAYANFLQGLPSHDPAAPTALAAFYQAKRDLLKQGLRTHTKLVPYRCPSTYFLLADYSQISGETEAAFAQRLVKECGVATIPVSAFYRLPVERKTIRLCFAKRDETLRAGLERLAQL